MTKPQKTLQPWISSHPPPTFTTHLTNTLIWLYMDTVLEMCWDLGWRQLTFPHIKHHRQSFCWMSVINFAVDDFTTLTSDMLHYFHPRLPWASRIRHACCDILYLLSIIKRIKFIKAFDFNYSNWSYKNCSMIYFGCYARRHIMSQLIKYSMVLKHKQTEHQGDPNSWSSSASPLTEIRAPLIVYSLLGSESFPPVQVFLSHNQSCDIMCLCCWSLWAERW